MIRFICKTNVNQTDRSDLKKDIILSNNNLLKNENMFINVFDFYSNQKYYLFYKDDEIVSLLVEQLY